MLSKKRIEQGILAGDWQRLLDDVLANGRQVDLPIRMRLSQADTLPIASVALALRRLNELEFALSPTAAAVVQGLVAGQEADGSFGTVAATAMVVRALIATLEQPGCETLEPRVSEAIELAVRFLALHQGDNGLWFDSEIDSAITAWQLADSQAFTNAVRMEDLIEALDDSPWVCVTPERHAVLALAS